jgi:peptidoglycan/LPS O-acetylase OafA/YrhL
VLVSVLFSFVLLSLGLYRFDQAGALTRSPWLVGHLFQGQAAFPWKLADAVAQGVFFTFFKESSAYWNTPLWTMRWEFLGSFAAFGLALLVRPLDGRQRAFILAVAVALTGYTLPQLAPFTVGVALAALLPRTRTAGAAPALVALAAGLYLMGYLGRPVGAYAWLYGALGPSTPAFYVQTAAAVLIITAVEISTVTRRVLSHRLSAWLGAMSFPLYLVHIPILCSFGSMAALATGRGLWGAVVTLVLSFVAAVPLMAFNQWWVAWLNRRIAPPRPVLAAALS